MVTDAELISIAYDCNAIPESCTDETLIAFARAVIERNKADLTLLTDAHIDAIAEAMPDGLNGFLKGWGWRQFARKIEDRCLPMRSVMEEELAVVKNKLDYLLKAAKEEPLATLKLANAIKAITGDDQFVPPGIHYTKW